MEDKKNESGFPFSGTADEVNAHLSKIIGSTSLFKACEQTPAPLTASLARIGAHLDRLATSALRAMNLEGVLLRLSERPDRRQAQSQELSRSAPMQQTTPSHKG